MRAGCTSRRCGPGSGTTTANASRSRVPGPDAATARTPGVVRMARIRRRFAADRDLSYGPAGRANLLDIWRRDDLPRDAARAGARADAGRRLDDRQQAAPGLPVDEPPRRTRLGVRRDQLPAQPAPPLAGAHRRRQARDRLGARAHRRLRRRPGLPRPHRRLGRRPSLIAGRAHPERPAVATGLRGRRHLGRGRGAVLRRLRLDRPRGSATRTSALLERLVINGRRIADDHATFDAASPMCRINADGAAVPRLARHQRHADPGRAGAAVRRPAARRRHPPGRLRRAARRPACLRHLRHPARHGRGRSRRRASSAWCTASTAPPAPDQSPGSLLARRYDRFSRRKPVVRNRELGELRHRRDALGPVGIIGAGRLGQRLLRSRRQSRGRVGQQLTGVVGRRFLRVDGRVSRFRRHTSSVPVAACRPRRKATRP